MGSTCAGYYPEFNTQDPGNFAFAILFALSLQKFYELSILVIANIQMNYLQTNSLYFRI